jgi:hypothetical protein
MKCTRLFTPPHPKFLAKDRRQRSAPIIAHCVCVPVCLFLFPRVPVCLRAPLPVRPPSVPKAAVSLRSAPAHRGYFGCRHKSPTARRRRFLRPPARTTRSTRPAPGAPSLLVGSPGGEAPAGRSPRRGGATLAPRLPGPPVANPGIDAGHSPAVRQLSP